MASRKSGAVRARQIQNRRVMSSSSGFASSASSEISRGSSAMPQMGQLPGPTCTDLRVHGAGVLRAWPRRRRRRLGLVVTAVGERATSRGARPRGSALNLLQAARAAEVVGGTVVRVMVRRAVGVDGHAAHEVLRGLAHPRSLRRPGATRSTHGTAPALSIRMRTMLATLMLGWSWAFGRGHAGRRPPLGETPRATDLLRAERLADDVRRRLELPAAAGHGRLAHRRRGLAAARRARCPAGAGRRRHHQRQAAGPAARRRSPAALTRVGRTCAACRALLRLVRPNVKPLWHSGSGELEPVDPDETRVGVDFAKAAGYSPTL